jgi:ferredoxin-NADP reductase
LKQVEYRPWFSDKQGFITIKAIAEQSDGLQDKAFFICGPMPMMDALTKQLTTAGVPADHIFTEDFSYI